MNKFIRTNIWNILMATGATILGWGIMSTRVAAIEKFQQENKPLIERFIQLEERDRQLIQTVENINEKVDLIIEQHIQLKSQIEK